MATRVNEITLDFVSNLKFTEFCVLVFGFLKNSLNIQEDDFFKIELSLREVINNAIVHGNKMNPQKRVYVKFNWSESLIRIRIKDENQEKVDFEKINSELANNDLLSFNGRGIMIMKSYMDKVEFRPSNKGTEIILEKTL